MEVCSFCGRKISQVARMIKAPSKEDVYICDNCIGICVNVLSKKKTTTAKVPENNVGKEFSDIDGLVPSQIHHELNRFIVGQEHAKKVLSVAIYNHNKRLHDDTGLIKKSNILIAGPSGCGKTLLARSLARMLNLPFVTVDATGLTEAGYVGDDVEVCLQRLLEKANGDLELAQKGIVYIDEIDKIARAGDSRSASRDVSGEGVQDALLKLIEGCEVSIPASGYKKGMPMQSIQFDTSNVLFICGGAFEGLFSNEEEGPLGFDIGDKYEVIDADQIANKKLTQKALIKYGMRPELIGRTPILCALTELKEDELVRVLVEPEDAITKEYQLLFEKDGIKLTYEDDALHEIAKIAIEKGTGARGLRTILEDVMLDIMYKIPDEENVAECVITKDSINTKNVKIIKKQENE